MSSNVATAAKTTVSCDDIHSMTAKQLIKTLTSTFLSFIHNDCIYKHPAVFLKGQPGVGKSRCIKTIAEELRVKTKKKVTITDIRLLMFHPVDLRGIPIADSSKRTAIWLRPEIFDLSEDQNVVNILFLDELTSAPQSLQAAAYQIALDKKIGEHKLPDNTFVIAAGNRTADNAVTYGMPSALKNRFIHFEIRPDAKEWLDWAQEQGIDSRIIEFIKKNPNFLSTEDFDRQKSVIVTPRSWEILSIMLTQLGGTIDQHEAVISSVVGNALTRLMLNNKPNTIDIQTILEGRWDETPKSISDIQYVTGVLENKVSSYANNQEQTANVLKYMLELPIDFSLRIFRKLIQLNIDEYELHELSAFENYVEKLNDYEH